MGRIRSFPNALSVNEEGMVLIIRWLKQNLPLVGDIQPLENPTRRRRGFYGLRMSLHNGVYNDVVLRSYEASVEKGVLPFETADKLKPIYPAGRRELDRSQEEPGWWTRSLNATHILWVYLLDGYVILLDAAASLPYFEEYVASTDERDYNVTGAPNGERQEVPDPKYRGPGMFAGFFRADGRSWAFPSTKSLRKLSNITEFCPVPLEYVRSIPNGIVHEGFLLPKDGDFSLQVGAPSGIVPPTLSSTQEKK